MRAPLRLAPAPAARSREERRAERDAGGDEAEVEDPPAWTLAGRAGD